jgi:hypothetical protein
MQRARMRARFPQRARLSGRQRPWAHARPNPPTPPRATEHARAHESSSDVTVVFFWSAVARAVAPSAPIQLPAAAQHPRRDPRPRVSGAIQKAERARTGSLAHARAPLTPAGRAQPEARMHRARMRARFSQRARLRGRQRPWAHAPPNPSTPPWATKHARAHSRLSDVTVVFFWSAVARAVAPSAPIQLSAAAQHPRRDPRPWVSGAIQKAERARTGSLAHARASPTPAGRAQPEARARIAPGRARFPQRARLRRRKRPRAHKPPNPPTPPWATEHARAHSRLSDVSVVFFWSAVARAVAPAL